MRVSAKVKTVSRHSIAQFHRIGRAWSDSNAPAPWFIKVSCVRSLVVSVSISKTQVVVVFNLYQASAIFFLDNAAPRVLPIA